MKHAIQFLMSLGAAAASAATIQTVTITPASQMPDGLVKITYSLDEPAIVMMTVKTNGAAVADAAITHAFGDFRRKVPAGDGTIRWAVEKDLNGVLPNGFTVELTPWSLANPPEVMVVDLRAPNNFTFYRSVDDLPDGGLANDKYRAGLMVMKKLPMKGVTFRCGSATAESGRLAPFLNTFTNDFYFGIYPVTQSQCLTVTGETASEPSSDPESHLHPVNKVKYDSVRGTVYFWPGNGHQVTDGSHLGKFRKLGLKFDLPTSTQWEFACRAGTQGDYYNGKDASHFDEIGWSNENGKDADGNPVSHSVGRKQANAFGLYDMLGNVNEWTLDIYRPSELENRTTVTQIDYPGLSAGVIYNNIDYRAARTRRGGSVDNAASSCTAASFSNYNRNSGPYTFNGYRLCVSAEIP